MSDAERDEDLLARFVEGRDERSFATLMRRHEDRIYALAYRMMGQRSDALDATQETFIAAFRRADSFKGDASFGTWLYSVGLNACRDLLRKKARLPASESDHWDEGREPATDPIEDGIAVRLDLHSALAALPEDYRTAVAMHDLGGFPYDEIATITKTNIGTVKSRISRGRRRLAALMEQPTAPQTSKD